jgi:hypothetical protein
MGNQVDFYSDYPEDSSACMIDNFRPDNKIYARTIAPVFQYKSLAGILGEKSVGIVKIDVEGAELEVVKSLLELIKRDKPIILIELLPVYSVDNIFRKNRQDELEQIFTDTDYAISRVEKTPSNAFSCLNPVEEIEIHSDLTRCDYVILPSAQLAELQLTSESPVSKAPNPSSGLASR